MNKTLRWGAGVTLGFLFGSALSGLVQPANVNAADHLDFPMGMLERGNPDDFLVEDAADLTDLLAWTPEKGRMAVVMNAHPGAGPDSRLSDAVDYQVRLRGVKMTDTGTNVSLPVATDAQEAVIKCVAADDRVTCATPLGELTAQWGGGIASLPDGTVRMAAGLRADSFFVDIKPIVATLKTAAAGPDGHQKLFPRPGEAENTVGHGNVLSIAFEFDVAAMMGPQLGDGLVAVNLETARRPL